MINFSKKSDSDIQIAAARVYARGSAIFLPSVLDKIGLVLKLIDAQDSKDEEAKPEAAAAESEPAKEW